MATSYSKDLVESIMPQIQQYEATTGRKISRSMMDSLFRKQLEVMAEKDTQTRALDLQQQQINSQDLAAKNAASAAKTSGIVQSVSTAGTLGLGYKYLSQNQPAPAVGTTPAVAPTSAPAVGGQAALTGSTPAVGGQSAMVGVSAPESVAGSGMGEGLAGTFGEGYGAAGSGIGVGTFAYPAAGAAVAHALGTPLAKVLNTHPKTTADVAGTSAGAAIGGAMAAGTTVGGPVGAVIGGVVGLGVSLASDTVICSELLRQGEITDRERQAWYSDSAISPTICSLRTLSGPLR
jgi:hypothetical protein